MSQSTRMLEMHDEGLISDEVLMLYGISGDLPNLVEYGDMSPRQREDLWSERLENRLGRNWRQIFRRSGYSMPAFLKLAERTHNWLAEGF